VNQSNVEEEGLVQEEDKEGIGDGKGGEEE
jgi:hypothetical protein